MTAKNDASAQGKGYDIEHDAVTTEVKRTPRFNVKNPKVVHPESYVRGKRPRQKCSRCDGKGHNKTTCTKAAKVDMVGKETRRFEKSASTTQKKPDGRKGGKCNSTAQRKRKLKKVIDDDSPSQPKKKVSASKSGQADGGRRRQSVSCGLQGQCMGAKSLQGK